MHSAPALELGRGRLLAGRDRFVTASRRLLATTAFFFGDSRHGEARRAKRLLKVVSPSRWAVAIFPFPRLQYGR